MEGENWKCTWKVWPSGFPGSFTSADGMRIGSALGRFGHLGSQIPSPQLREMRIVSVLGRFVYNFILFCALVFLFLFSRRSVFLWMFGNCIGTFFSPFSANTYLPYVLFLLRFRKWYIYGAILD